MRFADLLTESYEYSLLLETEQRAAWLLKNFGPKLGEKFRKDLDNLSARLVAEILGVPNAQLLANPDTNDANVAIAVGGIAKVLAGDEVEIQKKLIEYMMKADPTPNKAYARWIVLRYLKNNERLEDISVHLHDTLAVYARAAAARRVNGNIDAFKTISELVTAVEPFLLGDREVSGKEDKKNRRNTSVDTRKEKQWENDPLLAEADVIYDGDDYMVLTPKTEKAAVHFGKNTHWCTTNGSFDTYNTDGPLYIILRRKDAKRWQFHFETHQFMDELDRSVDLNDWIDENQVPFNAIGQEKFLKEVGRVNRYGHFVLSFRHFPKEMVENAPEDALLGSISTIKDLKAMPQKRVMTHEFFEKLLDVIDETYDERYRGSGRIKPEQAHELVLYYADQQHYGLEYLENLVVKHKWLLKNLPTDLQSDELKEFLAERVHGFVPYEDLIPKPWTKPIEEKYWMIRCKQDAWLRAVPGNKAVDYRGRERDNFLPEDFRTDENLIHLLAEHPEDISEFEDRLNPDFVMKMAEQEMDSPYKLYKILDALPDQYLNKELQLPIYKEAQTLTTKAEEEKRDAYLQCLTLFHNDHWPWKASRIMGRMAVVNKNFHSNPVQFHSASQAEKWAAYHPTKLSTLTPEVLNEDVVKAALLSKNHTRGTDTSTFIDDVLDPCDPKIVKPEWVEKAIGELNKTEPEGLAKHWKGIPPKYLTRGMIDTLLEGGNIAFDDEAFPKDAFTGENIVARFNQVVNPTYKYRISREEAEERARKNGSDPRYVSFNHEVSKDNIDGMKSQWKKLPEFVDKKKALLALLSYRNSEGFGRDRGKWVAMPRAVDKSLLNDPEVLTAWLTNMERYGYKGEDPKTIFKLFPKSAYNAENMALAVENKIISKVPEHLHDGDVIANMLLNDAKNLDWSKLTPESLITAISRGSWDVAHQIQYASPKNKKLVSKALSDPKVALAFFSEIGRQRDWSTGNSRSIVSENQIAELFRDSPELRKNWNQECFDLAAGNIVALKDIPEQYWSDAVQLRAVKTAPESIRQIKKPLKFLEKEGDSLSPACRKSLLGYGFALTDNGWIDVTQAKKKTVPNQPGSYLFQKMSPRGEALVIFDDDGKCLNALITSDSNFFSEGDYDKSIWALGKSDAAISALRPYRALFAQAFKENPKFQSLIKGGHMEGMRNFERMQLFNAGDYSNPRYVPIEEFPRQPVSKDSALTYVVPESSRWGGVAHYMFDGANGSLVGVIHIETKGNGSSVSSSNLSTSSRMKALLDLSKGFAEFLHLKKIASGQSPTFKETDLFTKLGVRGPGRGQWFSYLEKKVQTKGDYSVWTYGEPSSKDFRVSITSNKLGLLTIGKRFKDGTYGYEAVERENQSKWHKQVREIYDSLKLD